MRHGISFLLAHNSNFVRAITEPAPRKDFINRISTVKPHFSSLNCGFFYIFDELEITAAERSLCKLANSHTLNHVKYREFSYHHVTWITNNANNAQLPLHSAIDGNGSFLYLEREWRNATFSRYHAAIYLTVFVYIFQRLTSKGRSFTLRPTSVTKTSSRNSN